MFFFDKKKQFIFELRDLMRVNVLRLTGNHRHEGRKLTRNNLLKSRLFTFSSRSCSTAKTLRFWFFFLDFIIQLMT